MHSVVNIESVYSCLNGHYIFRFVVIKMYDWKDSDTNIIIIIYQYNRSLVYWVRVGIEWAIH